MLGKSLSTFRLVGKTYVHRKFLLATESLYKQNCSFKFLFINQITVHITKPLNFLDELNVVWRKQINLKFFLLWLYMFLFFQSRCCKQFSTNCIRIKWNTGLAWNISQKTTKQPHGKNTKKQYKIMKLWFHFHIFYWKETKVGFSTCYTKLI